MNGLLAHEMRPAKMQPRSHEDSTPHEECTQGFSSWFRVFVARNVATTTGTDWCLSQREAVERGLAEVLLDLHLDGRHATGAELLQLAANPPREQLGQHLHGSVRDRQQGAVAAREHITRRALVGNRHRFAVFGDLQPRVLERKEDLMVDLVAQPAHDLLERHEIKDPPALLVDRSLHGDTGPIVVPVQPFTAVTGKRDEVRRRKDVIVLADGDAEVPAWLHLTLYFP